jgi:hypothetical protein
MSEEDRPIKDSGERHDFGTGSVRDTNKGKGRYNMISPLMLSQVRDKYLANMAEGMLGYRTGKGNVRHFRYALACLFTEAGGFYHAMKDLAILYEKGMDKYDSDHCDRPTEPYNWEKGQQLSRLYDSAVRHYCQHKRGEKDEFHLSSSLWNTTAIIHTIHAVERGHLPASLLDFPDISWHPAEVQKQPSIYISGKMGDMHEKNFPRFYEVERAWINTGWDVHNPAAHQGKSVPECFCLDFQAVIDCDAIAMIDELDIRDGWEYSSGAKAELLVALKCGKEAFCARTPVPADWPLVLSNATPYYITRIKELFNGTTIDRGGA